MNKSLLLDNDLLLNSFKEHPIFSYFWNESVMDCFTDDMELDVVNNLDMNFHQRKIEMPLQKIKETEELNGMSAKLLITLTSVKDKAFDVNQAITDIDKNGAVYAIMINIDIVDENRKAVYATQFNLGSKEGEKINANSEYLKRLSLLY